MLFENGVNPSGKPWGIIGGLGGGVIPDEDGEDEEGVEEKEVEEVAEEVEDEKVEEEEEEWEEEAKDESDVYR